LTWEDAGHEASPGLRRIVMDYSRDIAEGETITLRLPSIYAVADALGRDIRATTGGLLALFVDQIDQVGADFFVPICNLLRRSGNFVAILAMRPCPVAPDQESLPADLVAGDAFRVLPLGKTLSQVAAHRFVLDVVKNLPIDWKTRTAIE